LINGDLEKLKELSRSKKCWFRQAQSARPSKKSKWACWVYRSKLYILSISEYADTRLLSLSQLIEHVEISNSSLNNLPNFPHLISS
jgi:hypothetical protein